MNEKFQRLRSCGIESFEFIVSERVHVNPDSSRAMNALTFLLFKLNKYTANKNRQPKWCKSRFVLVY